MSASLAGLDGSHGALHPAADREQLSVSEEGTQEQGKCVTMLAGYILQLPAISGLGTPLDATSESGR